MRSLNRLAGVGLVFLALFCAGCHRPDTLTTNDGFISPLKPADITYEELASKYNAQVAPVDTLWSRADIEIEWFEIDDDGGRKYRSESGDGKFIMRAFRHGPTAAPTETAMTVEKLGKIYLWAGSNHDQYYLFDRVDGDNKTLFVGTHLALNSGRAKPYPLPIRPSVVPMLLGLEPLDMLQVPWESEPTIDRYRDKYLLSIPDQGLRMLIDPTTYRPTRVDLTDARGYSVLTAKLSGQLEIDTNEQRESQPLLCERAEVYVAGYESRFTLDFQSATTSKRRVKEQMFDLNALKKALKPDRVIDLDQ